MPDSFLASNEFPGDGSTTLFNISFKGNRPDAGGGVVPYLNPADVKAQVVTPATASSPEIAVDVPCVYVGPNQFSVSPATPVGKVTRIYRATQDEYALVDYKALQTVSEADLDMSNRQVVFIVQETHDLATRAAAKADEVNQVAYDAAAAAEAAAESSAEAAELAQAAAEQAANTAESTNAALIRAVRVPPTDVSIPELPTAAFRANKVMGFDPLGNPTAFAPASGSATDLAIALANNTDPLKGAGLIGYSGETVYSALTAMIRATNLANNTDPLKGLALVGYKGRTAAARMGDTVSVKDYGAKGDGVTDDTAAIQAAVEYLHSIGGGRLYFPVGVYITGKITVYANIWLVGCGRDLTVIKLKNAANTDLIYGALSDTLWLTTSIAGNTNVGLMDLTLHGNRANNTVGKCFANYGDDLFIQNVWMTQAAEEFMRTDFYNSEDAYGMEGHIINLKMDTCGKDGWRYDGPHDSVIVNCTIVDAGQLATNTYDALKIGPRSNGRFIGCHTWTRSSSARTRYGLNIMDTGGGNEFTASHFEGSFTANVRVACSGNIFDRSCRIYYPWNGINMVLTGTATVNVIHATFGGPIPGRPACYAIVLGEAAGNFVAENDIDIQCTENNNGAIWFNFDSGNHIKVRGYQSTGVGSFGTPSTATRADIVARGSSSPLISTLEQATSLSCGPGAGVSWTFPFAFGSSPKVFFSVRQPSGAMDGHCWISALSATSVTLFNNSTRTITFDVMAKRI